MAPRIAALIGHADDFSLLEGCIAHLRVFGIDAIAVTVDADFAGNQAGLRALARRDIRVVYHRESDRNAFYFLRKTAVETANWARADWLLAIDSDEMILGNSRSIQLIPELRNADILRIRRYNTLPESRDMNADFLADTRQALAVTRPLAVDIESLEGGGSPWILSKINPRNLFRTSILSRLIIGGHAVAPEARDRLVDCDSVVVLHFPFTSFERFERKVLRIAQILNMKVQEFKPGEALHWKRWAAIAASGGLRAEYERQWLDPEQLAALRADGTIAPAEVLLA